MVLEVLPMSHLKIQSKKILYKYKTMSIVAKASIWAFFASIIQKGIIVLATPIFTRILSSEQFAQYTLYQSWHDIFIIFASLNVFNYATYSGLSKYDKDKENFIYNAQILVTGLTLLCCILYYIIHLIIGDILKFPLHIIIIMFLDILFFSSFNLWTTKERFDFKYKLSTVLSVIVGTLGPVLGLILTYYCSNKGYGRIYGVAIINILFGLGIYLFNIVKSTLKIKKEYFKFILLYCIPLIPHFLASQVLTRFDRIMISNMTGDGNAGIYGLAYSLSSLMIIFNDAIFKSLTPFTYQSIKSNNNLKLLKKNINYITIFVAIINFMLVLFAPEIIKVFATQEYYEAIYIIPSVSASVYLMYLFNLFANIEYYYSETKYVTFASIAAAICNVILNLIFIKKFGYIAAGYTTLISYILYAVGHYVFMKKVEKKYTNNYSFYDNKSIFLISLLFIFSCLIVIPIYNNYFIRYFIIILLFLIIFVYRRKIIYIFKKKN